MQQRKKRGKNSPKCSKPEGVKLPNLSKYIITVYGVYSTLIHAFLRGCLGSKGYLQVALVCDDGKLRWFAIHRLIAQAHVPNPLKLPIAHHCDHVKTHNTASNLSWVSHRQNIQLAAKAGRMAKPKGPENPNYGKKLTPETKAKISKAKKGFGSYRCRGPYRYAGKTADTLKGLSQALNMPHSHIRQLYRRGKVKRILKP